MEKNKCGNRYSPEVRMRAVRMVFEHQGEFDSQSAAIKSIAPKIGCGPDTLRAWVRRSETDRLSSGERFGIMQAVLFIISSQNCCGCGSRTPEGRSVPDSMLRMAISNARMDGRTSRMSPRFGYLETRSMNSGGA